MGLGVFVVYSAGAGGKVYQNTSVLYFVKLLDAYHPCGAGVEYHVSRGDAFRQLRKINGTAAMVFCVNAVGVLSGADSNIDTHIDQKPCKGLGYASVAADDGAVTVHGVECILHGNTQGGLGGGDGVQLFEAKVLIDIEYSKADNVGK